MDVEPTNAMTAQQQVLEAMEEELRQF